MPVRHTLQWLVAAVAGAVLLAGCGGDGGQQSASQPASQQDKTLHLAFYSDAVTVDPDVFYDIEGDALTQSVYDGLLRYKAGSTELEGALAESYDVSADGRRYTFKLRDAKFSDGGAVTSDVVAQSFKRRTAVNQGPAYMLGEVARYDTPDDKTFVVMLKKPVADFPDLLASVWGPKVIDPKVLDAHASDDAQKYLKSHASGTGPFMLTSFKQGTGYTLTRNPNYWDEKPYFDRVQIAIMPDVSAQILKLQRGDLDAILHGVPLANLDAIKGTDGVKVAQYDSLGTSTLSLNAKRPALKDPAVRRAVVTALDVPNLVKSVWGDTATVMTGAYPQPLLASESAPVSYPYDPQQVKAALPQGLSLDVVYTPDSSGVQRRLADLIRQKLSSVGVTVKERQVELATVFGYRDDVKNAADIYLSTPTPDAAHPDAWGRIVWYTQGGLNFFNYSNPKVDAALDAGLSEQDPDASAENYAEAGRLATADWEVAPIAQVKDLMALRSDLTGVEHVPAYPWTLNLGALGRQP